MMRALQLDPLPIEKRVLRTDRLLLRPLGEEDRAAFVAFEEANSAFFARYAPHPPGVVDAGSAFERVLRRTDEGFAGGTAVRLSMFLLERGDLVGHISIGDIVRGQAQRANIGYRVGERFCRRGLATEALRAVAEYGLAAEGAERAERAEGDAGGLGLHRVECSVQPENAASLAVARKAGFVQEGYFPRFLFIGGEWRDHLILARRAD